MTPDQEKIRALAEFRSALRRFLAFSEEAATAAGTSSQQYQALLAIGGATSLTVGALGRELLLKPNAAVQLIDRLEAQGLVARERTEGDRRAVGVTLTSEGRALLQRLAGLHLGQLAKRQKQFADVLRRLRQTQMDVE